ncbi:MULTISPECIES: TetR/AcrR family transcriptional regulator [unclassified Mycobacterium]|uniref:TetR/AcrR family transcriptional regulator n=1 Tax=unclassified Mycobacterium TaxID=2642494 RepID=UPI0007FE69CA|nr:MULTISPECIES: TetR/AcrR family transcriptional regulator [unclassified Mycobacterium]OBG57626.1 TetR family transcriptional regulator [Mycobacterium sp. E735]OBG60310.1 TetR family transcriptional regulator [Mycobacterium sp. E188]OBG81797.1 TetR family transcriptional regulator [Mycobacterium sp. E3305]OBH21628.1 TetR family transcriptional regulator [Mycobacterium sp. E1715]OBH33140.1 TetR family transcriptional regulator [Mycobacterium sp. E183]
MAQDGRRTQAERAADTRGALISAARPLFASLGFAEASLETIVRDAGVTRGALYHHFADKTELFAAVFEQVEGEMAARMVDAVAAAGHTDPVEIMRLCAGLWLDACSDPEVQRIVLLEALAVLGWERWSDIGHRYNIGFVTALLNDAIESGSIPRQPVEATALTVMGALREATLYIARADDQRQARADAGAVMDRLLNALRDKDS